MFVTNERIKQVMKAESTYYVYLATSNYPDDIKLDMRNFVYVTFHSFTGIETVKNSINDFNKIVQTALYAGMPLNDRISMVAFPDYDGSRSGMVYHISPQPDHCHVIVFCRSPREHDEICKLLDLLKDDFQGLVYKKCDKGSFLELLDYSIKAHRHDQKKYNTCKFEPIAFPLHQQRPNAKRKLASIANIRFIERKKMICIDRVKA